MKTEQDRSLQSRWLLAVLGIFLAATATAAALSPRSIVSGFGASGLSQHVHVTTDWSHRHMIFSAPKSLRQAFNLSANPRYVQQWNRRYAERRGLHPKVLHRDALLKGDWSSSVGGTASQGAGMYPAKFGFDVNSADCTNDFVVYGLNTAGSTTPVAAEDEILVSAQVPSGLTLTIIDAAGDVLTMTASTSNTSTSPGNGTFDADLDPTAEAADIATAINITGNGSFVGITAASTGTLVTMTVIPADAGPGGENWHFGTLPGQSTAGLNGSNGLAVAGGAFTYFANGATGTASIVGFNGLYEGCAPGAVEVIPNPIFTYNTGGNIHTSVTLSPDGTQIAFVQTIAGVANLSVLKWAAANRKFNALQITNCSLYCGTRVPSVTNVTTRDSADHLGQFQGGFQGGLSRARLAICLAISLAIPWAVL